MNLFIPLFALFTPFLHAAESPVDLSVGTALPSQNWAILDSPAALASSQTKLFDVAALMGAMGSPDFEASYSTGGGHFGFGAQVRKMTTQFSSTVGLGASTGKFSIGVNATTPLSPFSPVFGLGLRQELKSFWISLMIRDLARLSENWTLGIAFNWGNAFRLGFDFNFSNPRAQLVSIGEFYLNQKLTLRASYGFGIIPTLTPNQPGFGAGLNLWIGKKISLYGLFQPPDYGYSYTYIGGLKFFL